MRLSIIPLLVLTIAGCGGSSGSSEESWPPCAPDDAGEPIAVSFADTEPQVTPCCGALPEDGDMSAFGLDVSASLPTVALSVHLGTSTPAEGCLPASASLRGSLSVGVSIPLRLVQYRIEQLPDDRVEVVVNRAWFRESASQEWKLVDDLPAVEGSALAQ